jgi:hypothetical protein
VRTLALVGVMLAATAIAAADTPAQLQARGEKLAKDGQFLDAIDAFKQADAREPTAERACLIALAYTRRNLYPQAALFIATCHERAAMGAVPTWMPPIEREVRERLASGTFAPIELVVRHAGASVTISVSAFPPDETFQPRTIYLPAGHHVITATASGETRERELEVADRTPQRVVIDFAKETTPAPAPTIPPAPEPAITATAHVAGAAPSHAARDVLLVGAGLALAGGIVHLTWYRSELDELNASENPPDPARYDAATGSYQASRITAISLYGAGAATLIVGLVLLATHHDSADVMVSASHVDGGGVVSVGWRR